MYTTSDVLIQKVLRRCHWPTTDGEAPKSFADILALADDEISGQLMPDVVMSGGDYYTANVDYAIVSGTSRYRVPPHAYGPLRALTLIDSDGNETPITKMTVEDIGHASELPAARSGFYYYLDADDVILYPTPDATQNAIRMWYFEHPRALCLSALAQQVSTITRSLTAYVIGFGATPVFTSSQRLEFVRAGTGHSIIPRRATATSPDTAYVNGSNTTPFANLFLGTVVTTIGASSITFDSSNSPWLYYSDLRGYDWVTPSGYTPIVPLPDHMIPLLVERVAAACLRSHRDYEAFAAARENAGQLELRARSLLSPRVVSDVKITSTRNAPLRSGSQYRGGR